MRKLLLFCFCLSFFTCDDGDIITVELDFDDTFQQCGELVLFKTKTDPSESLSVVLNGVTLESLLEVDETGMLETIVNLGSTNTFNYRTYNTNLPANYFCSDIPPSGITILTDQESSQGTATITTILKEDDNDGIPAEFEDINGNGNLEDDDTDGDGIPNYLDVDDDGDNVLTTTESPNYTVDGGLNNAQNTDADLAGGDAIPDYLDPDDDGDGILTRDEETDGTILQDPTDDITDEASGIPDYLNPAVTGSIPATAYREHTIGQIFTISCIISDIQLPTLTQETFDFGDLEPVQTDSRTLTPEFN